MELRKPARRVWEEHESETAQHGIEGAIFETEGLPVCDHDRCVRQASQALAYPLRHGFETSAAMTWPPGPTMARAASAARPVPVATSSTRWPGSRRAARS